MVCSAPGVSQRVLTAFRILVESFRQAASAL